MLICRAISVRFILYYPVQKMSNSNHATDATMANNGQETKHAASMREFSAEEEDLITRMFRLVGNRWSLISGRLPGRTAKEIQEYWTSKCSSTSDSCSSSSQSS